MRRWIAAAWLAGTSLVACAAAPPSCPPAPSCPTCDPSAGDPVTSSSAVASAAPAGASVASLVASAAPPAAPVARPPRRRPTAVLFDGDRPVAGFPRGDAFALGIDGEALDALIREAEQTRSDALVVLKDHQIVAERFFGSRRGPIETMSVTKSITALAVMMLIEDGKIRSLDEPVGRFIPEFSRGKRASITLRHLLTQTSGLAHQKDAKTLNSQKDRTAFARKAEPAVEPGSAFSYNNSATQLLSVVVASAAGKPADAFLDQRLFRPLGIRGWQWARDEGKNVQTYYGLALEALDLARIGQLLLDQGRSGEQQLLSASSIQQLHTPGPKNPSYGLLWWIRHERVVHELDPAALARHEALARGPLGELGGRTFPSAEALWMEAGARLSPEARGAVAALAEGGSSLTRTRPDNPVGFYADGSLGQRLAIFPERRLVVVRQRRRRPAAEESEALSFPGMLKLAQALVRPVGEAAD